MEKERKRKQNPISSHLTPFRDSADTRLHNRFAFTTTHHKSRGVLQKRRRKKERIWKSRFPSLFTRGQDVLWRDPLEEQVGVRVQVLHASALQPERRDVIPRLSRRCRRRRCCCRRDGLFGIVDRAVRDDVGRQNSPEHLLCRHAGQRGERRRPPKVLIATRSSSTRVRLTADHRDDEHHPCNIQPSHPPLLFLLLLLLLSK